ncbi:MAG: hypothetical protein UHM19_07015 [Bacteroidales bacterium]|nr:hypothetical protein [Bacteroidales bacterium]
MKRLVLTIILSFVASITLAQDLEKFYMPQLQSKEDCAKYIGKKVCVFDYSSSNKRWKDAYKFEEYYWAFSHYEKIYTITKIKFGEQIEIRLVSNNGSKYKVKINNGGSSDYKALSSCNIFFLYDEFETYRNEQIGKTFKNSNNEEVAVLENLELIPRLDDDPVLVSTIRSKINNEEFICFSNKAVELCNRIGTIISNPKVKYSYKVLSVKNKMPEDKNGRFKYIYAERPWYTYENITTGKIGHCSAESILTEPFKEDLSGKYISLLAAVEKPSNTEIRYGETMTIPSENGISKFTYKDNVIDIMIFADRSNFNFVLQNISESSIKIVWDEAVFVNFDGSTEKVMHKGIKFSEKNGTQPATTIIKNAKWEDSVTPTHLVYYREATKYIEGGWDTYSMYPIENGLKPGQIKLMLPIQIKDVINEYVFVFDVQYVFNHPERLNLDLE